MESQKYSITLTPKIMLVLSLVYMLAFAVIEFIIYHVSSQLGIILYFIILFSLITKGTFAGIQSQRELWVALGLVPLIRIVSLATLITVEISQFWQYIIVSIPIIVGIIYVSRALKFNLDDIGLNFNQPLIQLVIVITGIGLALIGYFILKPSAWTDELTIRTILFPALVLIFTGVVEELAYRGVMQRAAGVLGSYGWIYIAAVYALLQLGQGSLLHCVFSFTASLFFGWMVKKTRSITGVGLSHGLINIGIYLILPHIF